MCLGEFQSLAGLPSCAGQGRFRNQVENITPTPCDHMSSDIQIKVEGTPNPNAAKFVLDRKVPSEGSASYFDASSAQGTTLAARLFEVDGVRALLIIDNFITVTKMDEFEWSDLVDTLVDTIQEAWRLLEEV